MSEYIVKTDEIDYCKVRVNYTADPEVVSKMQDEVLKQMKDFPVSGFRKGKATKKSLLQKYSKQVNGAIIQRMAQHANDDIIFETKIKPIGQPKFENVEFENNKFVCSVLYHKKPDFDLGKYKDLEIPKPDVGKSSEEVAELILQQLRTQNGEEIPYEEDDFVQEGDRVTLDYVFTSKDKEAVVKEGEIYAVGSNLYPDFDQNLYGMSAGEEREFDLSVNDDIVHCKVTMHMGLKYKPCPADDTLAKKLNIQTYDELCAQIKAEAEKQVKQQEDLMVLEQIKNQLVAAHDFKCPNFLVLMEAQSIAVQEGLNWIELKPEVQDFYLSRAEKNVKLSLILDSIQSVEPEVELSEQEVHQGLMQFLASRGVQDPAGYLNNSLKDGKIYGLVAQYRIQFVQNWLLQQAKIVE